MKVEQIGTVTKIGEPKTAGKSEVREIVLNKKYHDPDTGDLKSEDNYPVQIWSDKWSDFEKAYQKNAKMKITGFINGRLIDKAGVERCFMNFVGQNFEAL